ncbi:DUF7344 domain-containing protein [Haloarcula sediminis]|uniref:DUF7344 domain-containing protein n=1 Tax=Haloarcula sediminis TaxID=3111777 RepID=UPI002D774E93|nr:hypothetical protein [Haloarcula sp. CK38]
MRDKQARSDPPGGLPSRFADDELYRALSSRRRRRVLAFLLDKPECSLDELATVLAGWESTDTGGMSTPDDRERIQLDLHHMQLPLLAESGLVVYDRAQGAVTIETLDPDVRALIRRSVEAER